MGIPIFIRPAKETAAADLRELAIQNGALHFTVGNTGTVHFVPQKVTVHGIGAAGETLFDREAQAWYILAGGRREFDVVLPTPDCQRATSLAVDVEFSSTVVKESLQTPAGACAK